MYSTHLLFNKYPSENVMQSNSKRTKKKGYGLLRGGRDLKDTKKVLRFDNKSLSLFFFFFFLFFFPLLICELSGKLKTIVDRGIHKKQKMIKKRMQ